MAKNLVIVESPAKAKTIKKFLGSNYEVIASNGHVRDLPKSQMGIDIENNFEPKYITIRGKGELLAALRKEAKKAETLVIDKETVKSALASCGVSEEHVKAFDERFDKEFGKEVEIHPSNLIDKNFEVKTADVTIKVNPERTDLVRTRIIDGVKYILIRADESVEVNGVHIHIDQ